MVWCAKSETSGFGVTECAHSEISTSFFRAHSELEFNMWDFAL